MKTPPRFVLFFCALAWPCLAQPANPPQHDGPPRPIFAETPAVMSLEELRQVTIPNTTIDSVAVDPADDSCHVTATVTHPPANDHVKVFIALPMKKWNGRFRGNGGGGFVGGNPASLRGPAKQGFAVATTDTGHEGGSGSFALNANGRLNWQEIRDNAYLGIHDMTVVGKALATAFYGKAPRYSYFVGGSTGGRQGLMEAQRYPDDYDGIISACPAINWHRFVPASLWPQAVMFDAKNWVSKAKLSAVTAAAVAACDAADGVTDGVIDDPMHCTWDPKTFVGTHVGDEIFSEKDADVLRQIWDGPRRHDGSFIWHGLTRGADLLSYAGTEGTPLHGKPFNIALDWYRYFLVQSPSWEGTAMTRAEFELLWNQCVEEYGAVFGTDDPDLSRFRDHGGKVIVTHGLADQLIPPQGSIAYYQRVQKQMGGPERTAEFARLFLVPGVDHGFHGAGPGPVGLQDAIIRWVEEGKAPDRLLSELRDKSGKVTRTRPLFPYPRSARYTGKGSPDDAANFVSATTAAP